MSEQTMLDRVLSNPVRRALLERLEVASAPLGVDELARELGVHRNTVRRQLGVLEIVGLVEHDTEPPDGPGRPRSIFRRTAFDPR
ncbi:MAG: helix-turn-helix domain-containing protein [Nitriliruptoraceae bacterium]